MSSAVVFGAGGGIGRALTEALAASGRFDRIHAGARRLPGDLPAGVEPFAFDLGDEASIAEVAHSIGGQVELVLIASGVLQDASHAITPEKSFRAIDAEAMAQVLAINTVGPALIAKHFLPLLPRDRRAVFAALSARVGSIGDNRLGGWHSYRASKAALNMLIVNFAIELKRSHPHTIVAALHPGTVDTELSLPFQRGVAPDRLFTPATAAGHLLTVIDALAPADSGGLFAWDGTRLPS
ncbi:SDR family NAD(P)-dependent oxidoreductase [Novosphingobium sp.]|uniref:SDR family NAD(P)-dependent oxidoreductase n=1 Tax=Novosphingobium sp. TaxID=1874826 RepID=UPI0025CD49FA|nr:SDR family NAD(P)-dependent oxidoreductase [Novosphingobium sp.]